MKRILFLLILAAFALAFTSCEWFDTEPPTETIVEANRVTVIKSNPAVDTMTNADTSTFTFFTANSPIEYEFAVSADSLSGATAATCVLRQALDGGTDKITLKTVTVDGVSTRSRETGTVIAGALDCQCISSGTQSTAVRVDFNAATRNPQ